MRRWTFVCEDCHAGWEVESMFDPRFRSDTSTRCRWCGQPGIIRGMYLAKPL